MNINKYTGLTEIDFINKNYDREFKRFERAIRNVESILRDFFEDVGTEYVHYIKSRVKSKESILQNMSKKAYESVFREMKDIAGIRIVCHNESDKDEIASFIRDNYQTIEEENIAREDGYKAKHLVINVKVLRLGRFVDTKVEVQIRTIAEDLFATLSHRDIYKLNIDLPDSWKNKMKLLNDKLREVDGIAQELKDEWLEENEDKKIKDQLSVQTIIRLCKKILNQEVSVPDALRAFMNFITFDMRKISELEGMLSDEDIMNALNETYLKLLNRRPDINGISLYGSLLRISGAQQKENVIEIIKESIRASKEYSEKHKFHLGSQLARGYFTEED